MTNKQKQNQQNHIAALQQKNSYIPCKRGRSTGDALGYVDSQNLVAAFENSTRAGWSLTSNVRIKSTSNNAHHVQLNKHKRPRDTKGQRKFSKVFRTIVEAENNAYKFRYAQESASARCALGEWEKSLKEKPNKKQRQDDILDVANRRASTAKVMTSNLSVRKTTAANRNPNNQPYRHAQFSLEDVMNVSAKKYKIAFEWEIWSTQIIDWKIVSDQAYCRKVVAMLTKKLSSEEPWAVLVLGADDPEVFASLSDFDKAHAMKRSRHVADALRIMSSLLTNKLPMTW